MPTLRPLLLMIRALVVLAAVSAILVAFLAASALEAPNLTEGVDVHSATVSPCRRTARSACDTS
eukprot:852031-Prorocentrum_lima.AAC.1